MKKFMFMCAMLIGSVCFGQYNVDWDCSEAEVFNLTSGEPWIGYDDLIPGAGTGGAYCELDEEYQSHTDLLIGGFGVGDVVPPTNMGNTISNIDVKFHLNFDGDAADSVKVYTLMEWWNGTQWVGNTLHTEVHTNFNDDKDVTISQSPSAWGVSSVDLTELELGNMRVTFQVENNDVTEDGGDLDVFIDDLHFSAQD